MKYIKWDYDILGCLSEEEKRNCEAIDKYLEILHSQNKNISVGLSSTSVVHRHMQRLFRNGRFETEHPGEARAFRVISQNSKSTNKSIDKDGLLDYIKEEFPGVIDTHWNWDVLENIIDYATSKYNGEELIKFLMNIIPEVTYEEYLMFM